jgi:hypothetical protein
MNPLFFADWAHIHRVFRGVMWVLATVLMVVVFFAVSSGAYGDHAPAVPRAAEFVGPGH